MCVFSGQQNNTEQVNGETSFILFIILSFNDTFYCTYTEFLVLVRNLINKIQPERQSTAASSENTTQNNGKTSNSYWNKQNTSFPLESDSNVLEFLASFDYNTEKAWFHLCAMLGVGKGTFLHIDV